MSHTVEELRATLAVIYVGGDSSESEIRAWAEDHGYVVVGTVSSSEDHDPPGRVMELCGWNGARTVLVRDLSTLGSDLQSAHDALRKLYEAGISVVFVDRGLRVDGRTALGKLLMEMLSMATELAASHAQRQQPRRAGRPPRSISESDLMELRGRGMSVRAIAKALDVSKSTVWRKLRELESRKD
ncbi:MAG: helix-turn-helix domain-containing protein [Conexivisphaera sp.]|jgi:DNA invertase Pin-like site-specific DNA recombinase